MNKKNVALWALYDFANSIPVIVFLLYFSQWLVVDNNIPDLWYNLIFTGSSLLLLFTSPIAGAIADKIKIRMPFLIVLTVLMFISLFLSSAFAVLLPVGTQAALLASVAFMFANYFYQFSFSFYNAILPDLGSKQSQGFISGIGQTANWSGQIAGILITLPLATGAIVLIGNPGRAQTFLPATLLFFFLALPMLIFLKDKSPREKVKIDLAYEYKNLFVRLKQLLKTEGVGRFLIGYFFFNDAMVTAVSNFPIFLDEVFKISDKTKSILVMAILVTSAIGAFLVGWLSDKIGLKKMLLFADSQLRKLFLKF